MRRLSILLAASGLLTTLQGCHIAGKCDCDWPGYDASAPAALVPIAPVAQVAVVRKEVSQSEIAPPPAVTAPAPAKPAPAKSE
jgi:hypothetical protein